MMRGVRIGCRKTSATRVPPQLGSRRACAGAVLAVVVLAIAWAFVPGVAAAPPDDEAPTAFRELQLGFVALDAGDYDGALLHYLAARDLAHTREQRFNALLGAGTAAFELQRYGEARQALEEAHAIKPEDAETTFTLGVACRRDGELEQAVEYLAEAAARDPSLTTALVELGIAYGALGRHGAAEAVCRQALTLDPDNLEAMLGLGVALYHQDKNPEAVTVFRRFLELDPDDPRAHFGLGLALLYSGDRAGAIQEVVFLNQHSPELAEQLHGWIFPDD